MKKHYRHENDCLNCGAELQGKYCHVCGQENLQIKESFGHMMTHAISDYFHFDHQFFHTLRPLILKPGKLTNEYLAGRRVQYLHPVKMYIFISLVYFVLLFQSGHEEKVKITKKDKAGSKRDLVVNNQELDKALKDPNIPEYAKVYMRKAKDRNDAKLKDSTGKTKGESENADLVDDMVSSKVVEGRLPGASRAESYEAYLEKEAKLPADERDNFLERQYNKKSYTYIEKYGKNARKIFIEDVKHGIPKMMFLMLPLCALIFKLGFWKNKKYYVEHLIFTFHLHCFIFLFLTVINLLQMISPDTWGLDGWLDFAAFIGIIWYIYRSFRVFYQRSRWRTISKIFGVGTMYFMAFAFCITVLFAIMALV